MGFAEYSNYDGLGLAELVKKKKVKPAELVEAAIERIERHNRQLNAVVFKAYDEARAKATTKLSGAFAGVPMLLKDILGFKKGWPTRQGSRFVPAAPSTFDATLVARFEAAGLILLGKTNMPEFGILPLTEPKLCGPARNPWNLDHSTGGSSGGSAAAVATGIVPLACHRWRWFDPHPSLVLRPRRPQADTRTQFARADNWRHLWRPRRRACGEPQRARHRGGARCHRRPRDRRSLRRSSRARLLPCRDQEEAEKAPHRLCNKAARRRGI